MKHDRAEAACMIETCIVTAAESNERTQSTAQPFQKEPKTPHTSHLLSKMSMQVKTKVQCYS